MAQYDPVTANTMGQINPPYMSSKMGSTAVMNPNPSPLPSRNERDRREIQALVDELISLRVKTSPFSSESISGEDSVCKVQSSMKDADFSDFGVHAISDNYEWDKLSWKDLGMNCFVQTALRHLYLCPTWKTCLKEYFIETGAFRNPVVLVEDLLRRAHPWGSFNPYKWVAEAIFKLTHYIDARRKDGSTLLMLAAGRTCPWMLNLLLETGADVNAKDKFGWTSIFKVVNSPDAHGERCLRMLLAHGARSDEKDNYGRTPLMFAADHGHLGLMKILIDHGADVNAQAVSCYRSPPLNICGHANCLTSCLDMFSNGGLCPEGLKEMNFRQCNGEIPLSKAVRSGNGNATRLLLSHRADPNHTCECRSHRQPIIDAVYDDSGEDTLAAFLEHGADPNKKNADHRSLLELAIELTRPLSSYKESIMFNRPWGTLHTSEAVRKIRLKKLALLLEHGADIHAPCAHQASALAFALSCQCDNEVTYLLLEHGAKANCPVHTGSPTETYNALSLAALHRLSPKTIKKFIQHGGDFNAKNTSGKSATWYMCKYHNYATLLEIIVRSGADVESPDNEGITCLMVAAATTNVLAAEILLKYGGSFNAVDAKGRTALDFAKVSSDTPQKKQLMRLLRKAQKQAKSALIFQGLRSALSVSRRRSRVSSDTASVLSEKTLVADEHLDERVDTMLKIEEAGEEEVRSRISVSLNGTEDDAESIATLFHEGMSNTEGSDTARGSLSHH